MVRSCVYGIFAVSVTVATAGWPSQEFSVVVLPDTMRAAMSAIWVEHNRHWDELADVNTLTQLLGTGKPTQREYLGCLAGVVAWDTLWVHELRTAADLKQLQFAVTGSCDHVDHFVGTWHTHPYRADSIGHPIKERGLSALDLSTFAAAARDLVTIVMWDADSLDMGAKAADGTVRHPVRFVVR
ncbi:MAG: hypothetical protein ACREMF_06260 [Gemmatimonadales bacterium]